MKQLFTIKSDGYIWVEKEGDVYRNYKAGTCEYIDYDSNGNVIEHTRPAIDNPRKTDFLNDPSFIEEIGEGFYSYTTHDCFDDADGRYGCFGIKRVNGEVLTTEKYYQVAAFCHGLCSVREKDGLWGCINTQGCLIVPYKFDDCLVFNKYGVAVGNGSLVDTNGNEIADTQLNCIGDCDKYNRYFTFAFLSEQQISLIDEQCHTQDLTENIYDTKTKKYVIKDIPEDALSTSSFVGEPEVILAAAKMINQFDRITVCRKGTIVCEKAGFITVFDYYKY